VVETWVKPKRIANGLGTRRKLESRAMLAASSTWRSPATGREYATRRSTNDGEFFIATANATSFAQISGSYGPTQLVIPLAGDWTATATIRRALRSGSRLHQERFSSALRTRSFAFQAANGSRSLAIDGNGKSPAVRRREWQVPFEKR
jgi:hypothetical protein